MKYFFQAYYQVFTKFIVLILISSSIATLANAQNSVVKTVKPDTKATAKSTTKATSNPATQEEPIVVLETSVGKIVIQLHPKRAPLSVENFLNYVNNKFYDGVVFHRVIPNFMVQTGGLTDKFVEKRTEPPIKNESVGGLPNIAGSVAMARRPNPDSATAQFFINVVDNHYLNASARGPGYAVFGTVIEGFDIAVKISQVETGAHKNHYVAQQAPNEHIYINKAYVQKATANKSSTDKTEK